MRAYWSLGFHLCRWGYGNIRNLMAVIQVFSPLKLNFYLIHCAQRMDDANFPVDTQWTDIDVMRSHLDYTYDNGSFYGLPDLVRSFHSEGKHYVNIVDPGISSTQPAGSQPPYEEGLKRKIFIRKVNSTEPIIGKVWPGDTAFPDFTHPNATQWWTDMAQAYHDIVPFDGMWIVGPIIDIFHSSSIYHSVVLGYE